MKKRIRYTANQLEYLRIGYLLMNTRDLTAAFNDQFGTDKTESQIKATLKNHRIRCGRRGSDRIIRHRRVYTDEQVRFIRDNYKVFDAVELTARFNKKFGTDKKQTQIKAVITNRGFTSGRTGRFEKGHKTWNAGTKGLTGANKTSFRKGSVPPNRKPIGTERIDTKDGYIWIKVAEQDPYTGFPTRYKLKHRHIWEQANGPIPKGMVIAFRDGDKLNFDPGNLMLISRAENAQLNRHRYKDAPDGLKPSILALTKLEVKMFGLMKEKV